MSSALRFSVIIPLEFHRGQAVRCVRGWAEGQLFPRDQFEILIASPAGHPTAELDEVRGLLGPQDRVLEFDRHHDMDLCAKAAESASGEVLFFTESHCLPEPETLASADAVARENPDWAGFSCRSIPITGNLLSEIEAEWYGRDIEFGMNEHPWRKVLDQCFVVHRSAYFQAGGFDPAFGHFAEWLIAARFYALGLKIGYTPTVRVHHLYVGEFGEWQRFTADFLQGQMAYFALMPSDPLRGMFDEVPEWSRRHVLQRSVARRVCRMLLRDLRRSIDVGSAASPSGGLVVASTLALVAAQVVARPSSGRRLDGDDPRAAPAPHDPSRAAGGSPDPQPSPRRGAPRALLRGDRSSGAHPLPTDVGTRHRAREGEPPVSRRRAHG